MYEARSVTICHYYCAMKQICLLVEAWIRFYWVSRLLVLTCQGQLVAVLQVLSFIIVVVVAAAMHRDVVAGAVDISILVLEFSATGPARMHCPKTLVRGVRVMFFS